MKNKIILGIVVTVLYGLLLYYIFENITPYGRTLVSLSYFFIVPFILGYICVRFQLRDNPNSSYRKSIVVSWIPLLIILLISIVTLQEGSICVAMALPVFMFFSAIGGVLAKITTPYLDKKRVTLSVALLPLIFSPIENQLPEANQIYEVKNSIIINASPEVIWGQIGNVSDIHSSELSFSITRMIGIPRPLNAQMDGGTIGAIRTSTWDKGVVFKEVITEWKPQELMSYEFLIDPALIPDTALDKHVKMGGEYFSPVYGNYKLEQNADGTTRLSLSTTIRDNTKFGIYSRLWGEVIFRDFHNTLLRLIKDRSEAHS